jgi:hypothetical protein
VWSHDGIMCVADTRKSAVSLTFLKGAQLKDSKRLFSTRLDSSTVRVVDCFESDDLDKEALKELILEAAELNTSKVRR